MVQRGLGQRPLLFICHSLGGLVAKQILRTSYDAIQSESKRTVFNNTCAVLFLATPHVGAELASLIDSFRVVFGATMTIQDLRAHDAHLRNLFDWYRNHAGSEGIQTATYFELRSVKGVTIVNPTSAHPGVGADPVGLDEDHLSIAKPRDRQAQVCGAASALLRNAVLTPRIAGAAPSRVPPEVASHLPPLTASVSSQITELQQLLAELGTGESPSPDSNSQHLLAYVLEENRRLRDENESLKMKEAERVELVSKVDAVQQLLSNRDAP